MSRSFQGQAIALMLTALTLSVAACADTVTLRQGVDGYGGCAAATLWEPKTAKPKAGAADGVLYIRGTVGYRTPYEEKVVDKKTGKAKTVKKTRYRESGNRVLLKFDLPAKLKGRKLLRARLEVFAPEVRKLRMIRSPWASSMYLHPWALQFETVQ